MCGNNNAFYRVDEYTYSLAVPSPDGIFNKLIAEFNLIKPVVLLCYGFSPSDSLEIRSNSSLSL
jgi:hypothetical protein